MFCVMQSTLRKCPNFMYYVPCLRLPIFGIYKPYFVGVSPLYFKLRVCWCGAVPDQSCFMIITKMTCHSSADVIGTDLRRPVSVCDVFCTLGMFPVFHSAAITGTDQWGPTVVCGVLRLCVYIVTRLWPRLCFLYFTVRPSQVQISEGQQLCVVWFAQTVCILLSAPHLRLYSLYCSAKASSCVWCVVCVHTVCVYYCPSLT